LAWGRPGEEIEVASRHLPLAEAGEACRELESTGQSSEQGHESGESQNLDDSMRISQPEQAKTMRRRKHFRSTVVKIVNVRKPPADLFRRLTATLEMEEGKYPRQGLNL
jgi:hypothetical protein